MPSLSHQHKKCILSGVLLPLLILGSTALYAHTTLINLNSDGVVDNSIGSLNITHGISENGLATFNSGGTNLVTGDFNNESDVFVRDVRNGTTELISIRTDGGQSNGTSSLADISDDGRWILFSSTASNLDRPDNPNSPGLSNGIFLRDRQQNTTVLIGDGFLDSEFPRSGNLADMSTDANAIVFSAQELTRAGQQNPNGEQVYVYHRLTDELVLVSQRDGEPGNAPSGSPRISADGTRVTFTSFASNLITDTSISANPIPLVYLYDTLTQSTQLISVGLENTDPNNVSFIPSIDDSGRWVSFASGADNLVDNDTNGENDIFIRDTMLNTTILISQTREGVQGDAASGPAMLTGDGRGIVFSSSATNLLAYGPSIRGGSHAYYLDLDTQTIELVSQRVDGSAARITPGAPATTRDGRYIAFSSSDSELISPPGTGGPFFVYLHDRGDLCADEPENLEFNLSQAEWELLSLPCLPPEGSTVESLFADDLPGTFVRDWIIFTFDPLINNYRQATLDQTLVAGQGFWIIQNIAQQLTLRLPENSRSAGRNFIEGTNCTSDNGCRSLSLVRDTSNNRPISWNLLGNPFNLNTQLLFNNLRVVTPTGACSDGCTVDEASTQQTAFNVFYAYDSAAADYVPITTDESINTWSGFWIGALDNATLEDTRLVITD